MTNTRLHIDGAPDDGVGHDHATPYQLARYKHASAALGAFKVPVLIRANNPHERLFIVAFDGTGNNKFTDPKHATNVAKIDDDIMARQQFSGSRIYSHYVEGPGTQDNWLVAGADSLRGHSYGAKVEEAYAALVKQSNRWFNEDPQVVVSLHQFGFSRGASQAPGLARIVHERGIPLMDSRVVTAEGDVRYTRYIGRPGEVVQTVGLFDPVATGAPMKVDRRLPPSVMSAFQITAGDERRASFPSDQILPPGLSDDGRFLNITVPGAHSDVGGGYLRDGLSIRCGNLMRDYCNALSDVPYLEKEFEHTDERLNVIHRSTEGNALFRADPRVGVRGEASGTNEKLAPRHVADAGPLPHRAEPADPLIEARLTRRTAPIALENTVPSHAPIPAVSRDAVLAAGRSTSFVPTVVRGVVVADAALDLGRTLVRSHDLEKRGNRTGSDSELLHFGSRNVAGWVGAETMMAVGAAAGVETGPGLFVTGAIGGVVGFVAGDKIADKYDQYRVTHQPDSQGHTWRRDEEWKAWVRDVPPLPGAPHGRLVADAALAGQLTYQAGNTAVELALAKERKPSDPFVQPAARGDSPSLKDSPWVHSPHTHQWSRVVVDHYLEHGMLGSHVETATAQRAAKLDSQAAETIRQNVEESSLAVAQRYQYAYEQEGWARYGPMPEAVSYELMRPAGYVRASDGHEYSRARDGQWSTPGMLYGANAPSAITREELDLTEGPARDLRNRVDVDHAAPPPVPLILPTSLDHPAHPDHEFFRQIRGHVVELDKSLGRGPDHYTDRISSALTVQARADGLERVDHIGLSEHGDLLGAVQTSPWWNDHQLTLRTQVATAEAETPMEVSAAKWPEAMRQFERHEQARTERQQPARGREPAGLSNVDRSLAGQEHRPHSPDDPRNPASKHHDLYNELHRCLPDASDNRLVQFTAECHRNRITAKNLNEVHLDNHNLTMNFDSADFMSTPAQVDLNLPPPEPEEAIQQMRQFDQWMEEIRQQSQQHAQAIQQGPVLGG